MPPPIDSEATAEGQETTRDHTKNPPSLPKRMGTDAAIQAVLSAPDEEEVSESAERMERLDAFQSQLVEMRASIPRHIRGKNRTLLEGHITTLEAGIPNLRENLLDDGLFNIYRATVENTLQDFFTGVHVYTNKEGIRIVPIYIQRAHQALSDAFRNFTTTGNAPRMSFLKNGWSHEDELLRQYTDRCTPPDRIPHHIEDVRVFMHANRLPTRLHVRGADHLSVYASNARIASDGNTASFTVTEDVRSGWEDVVRDTRLSPAELTVHPRNIIDRANILRGTQEWIAHQKDRNGGIGLTHVVGVMHEKKQELQDLILCIGMAIKELTVKYRPLSAEAALKDQRKEIHAVRSFVLAELWRLERVLRHLFRYSREIYDGQNASKEEMTPPDLCENFRLALQFTLSALYIFERNIERAAYIQESDTYAPFASAYDALATGYEGFFDRLMDQLPFEFRVRDKELPAIVLEKRRINKEGASSVSVDLGAGVELTGELAENYRLSVTAVGNQEGRLTTDDPTAEDVPPVHAEAEGHTETPPGELSVDAPPPFVPPSLNVDAPAKEDDTERPTVVPIPLQHTRPPQKRTGLMHKVGKWGRVAALAVFALLGKPDVAPIEQTDAQQGVSGGETAVLDEEPVTQFQTVMGSNPWDTVKLTYEANAPTLPDLPKRIPATTNQLVGMHVQDLEEVSLPMDDPDFYKDTVKIKLTGWTGYKDVLKVADEAGATTFTQMLTAVDATYPGISRNIRGQIALTQPGASTIHQTINAQAPAAVQAVLTGLAK